MKINVKKENKREEKMTLGKLGKLVEKLAVLMVNGFEKVEKELGGLKTDVGGLKTDVGGLKTAVGVLQATVSETDDRVRKLERSVTRIESEMITPIDIEDLLGRVSYIERKLGIESGKRG